MTNIELVNRLTELGFVETTKPEYAIESYDEVVTSYRKYSYFKTFTKKWLTVYVPNIYSLDEITNTETEDLFETEANIKCELINKNVYPHETFKFEGTVSSVTNNEIELMYSKKYSFGTHNELSSHVEETGIYRVEIPED